jgi:hypothetical protein
MGLATETFKRKFPRSMESISAFNHYVDSLNLPKAEQTALIGKAMRIALMVAEEALDLKKQVDIARGIFGALAKARR